MHNAPEFVPFGQNILHMSVQIIFVHLALLCLIYGTTATPTTGEDYSRLSRIKGEGWTKRRLSISTNGEKRWRLSQDHGVRSVR